MDSIYLLSLVLLFIFAVFDLTVGVSNDAVNFLNSALGSKVASRKTILIIASMGVFLGAFLSSGMMEVARKGIFNPSAFIFPELIFIFLAVMMADIILLDVFSTLGLPTSTTISIVFCLLGAAMGISLIKISSLENLTLQHLNQYINAGGSLKIISGIFSSIFISFITGSFIHYFIRWAFSFNYEKRLKKIGFIWVSISLSAMTYFLIVKGIYAAIKGLDKSQINGFLSLLESLLNKVNDHPFIFLGSFFIFSCFISQLFIHLGYNLLKFIVLYGTFSLAMAFAGNDLVNFIGVPIAGFQAYELYHDAGFIKDLSMSGLGKNIQTPSFILILAGFIMVATLWFSKKAHNVAETEINLGRQEEGEEKFKASSLARFIVRLFRKMGRLFFSLFPKRLLVKIESNFKHNVKNEHLDFDLIRASSNLTLSSILIAIATSYKLPLSTTFVTFMIAMGTSLSDRAWGRESAVYRVTGVLRVISGWFVTALIAFITALIAATLLKLFQQWALFPLLGIMGYILYKNHKKHKQHIKQKELEKKASIEIDELNLAKTLHKTSDLLIYISEHLKEIYLKTINSLQEENIKELQQTKKLYSNLEAFFTATNNTLIKTLRKTKANEIGAGMLYLKIYNETRKIVETIGIVTHNSLEHVSNSHKPLKSKQRKNLDKLKNQLSAYLDLIVSMTNHLTLDKPEAIREISIKRKFILKQIDNQLKLQIMGIIAKKYGVKNSALLFDLLLKSKDIIKGFDNVFTIYYEHLSLLKKGTL